MAIEAKTKKWGNSIGIVIPRKEVERTGIKPGEEVVIDIERKNNVLKELFGKAKTRKPGKKIVEGLRKGLKSKWHD